MYPEGPLLVRGDFALVDESGGLIDSDRQVIALCRCGKSALAPLCDGSHARRRRPAKNLGAELPGPSGNEEKRINLVDPKQA